MYIKKNYGFWMTFDWSKKPFFAGLAYALLILILDRVFNITLTLPWAPIGVIGVALAFYLGFKNSSSYARINEAEKAYGEITNVSRSFGSGVIAFIKGENTNKIKVELIYRHIAWAAALKFQLRRSKPWEHIAERLNEKYKDSLLSYQANKGHLYEELKFLLPSREIEILKLKGNFAAQILNIQSRRLKELKDEGFLNDFEHIELHRAIMAMYDGQGAAETIKNFPLPRQYASTALHLTKIFVVIAPLGMYEGFVAVEHIKLLWAFPVISGFISWIFCLMERVGDYSENPFEGTYNDVPITAITRDIEIDLREMLNEENIPPAIKDENGFLL